MTDDQDPARFDPVVDPSMRPRTSGSSEPPDGTFVRIALAVSILIALGLVFWL
jgi:hypothetical protein